jgi:hypothetical protein
MKVLGYLRLRSQSLPKRAGLRRESSLIIAKLNLLSIVRSQSVVSQFGYFGFVGFGTVHSIVPLEHCLSVFRMFRFSFKMPDCILPKL